MPISRSIEHLFFVLLALSCLPLSTLFICVNYVYNYWSSRNPLRKQLMRIPGFKSNTILITGINTPHGLRLARALNYTGHTVVGADHEPGGLPVHVRFSRALSRFYRLPSETGNRDVEYIATLVQIIERENVDLWINCSHSTDLTLDTQATAVIEKNTRCHCFTLRAEHVPYLTNRDAFFEYLASLGLQVPETYRVTSRAEIHNLLGKAGRTRKYLLQSQDQDGPNAVSARTKLPRRTLSQTYNTLSSLTITNTAPWQLEQDINDLERYSTFAVIARGVVKAFVASQLISPGCYMVKEPKSALTRSMLQFVQAFASKQGAYFTTHLGIDFCVEEQSTQSGVVQAILPVSVSVHAQAATQLFHGKVGSIELSRAYLACLAEDESDIRNGTATPASAATTGQTLLDDVAIPDARIPGIYCFGQDLLHLWFEPLRDLVTYRKDLNQCLQQICQFLNHLIFWDDDTYTFEDPLPFWYSYQIYIPLRLIHTALFPERSLR